MAQWQTIIPIRGIDLSPDQRFDFAEGMTLEPLPDWVSSHPWLDKLGQHVKQSVQKATHGFVINYEAEALDSPDPAWQGPDLKSIQVVKYELAVLANFALWLSCPSPVRLACVIHAELRDSGPMVKYVGTAPRVFHHPKDSDRSPSTKDFKLAQRLHSSLAQLPRGEVLSGTPFRRYGRRCKRTLTSSAISYSGSPSNRSSDPTTGYKSASNCRSESPPFWLKITTRRKSYPQR